MKGLDRSVIRCLWPTFPAGALTVGGDVGAYPSTWTRSQALALGLLLFLPRLSASDRFFTAGAGIGPVRRPPRQAIGTVGIEAWSDSNRFGVWATLDAAHEGSWIGLGPSLGVHLSSKVRLSLSSGPGWYPDFRHLDLGSPLEFRSAATLSYRLASEWQLRVSLVHYSNGGLAHHNPGMEVISCSIAIPWRMTR